MNQVCFTGHLGGDPELRETNGGKSVCNLSVAVDGRGGRDSDEATLWLSVAVWDATAENCAKYLRKGSHVGVSGRLQPNKYTKRDGSEVEGVEVSAFAVDFLTPKSEREAAPAAKAAPTPAPVPDDDNEDPFGDFDE